MKKIYDSVNIYSALTGKEILSINYDLVEDMTLGLLLKDCFKHNLDDGIVVKCGISNY